MEHRYGLKGGNVQQNSGYQRTAQPVKDIHALIRDLPFVTNVSKFYDESVINSNYDNTKELKNGYLNNNNQGIVNNSINRKDFDKAANPHIPFFNGAVDEKTLLDESGLKVDDKNQSKYKNLDDEIFEDMQRQLCVTDSLEGKSIDKMNDEDFDKLITPQHKESVRKLREILDI